MNKELAHTDVPGKRSGPTQCPKHKVGTTFTPQLTAEGKEGQSRLAVPRWTHCWLASCTPRLCEEAGTEVTCTGSVNTGGRMKRCPCLGHDNREFQGHQGLQLPHSSLCTLTQYPGGSLSPCSGPVSAMQNPGQETVLLKDKFWVILLVALSTTPMGSLPAHLWVPWPWGPRDPHSQLTKRPSESMYSGVFQRTTQLVTRKAGLFQNSHQPETLLRPRLGEEEWAGCLTPGLRQACGAHGARCPQGLSSL